MSNTYRTYRASELFKYKILESTGNEFEDLFTELMKQVYPIEFKQVKPDGKNGDRKNDGYVKGKGTFYQVYAPEDLSKKYTQNNAKSKIDDDFKGLLEYWDKIEQVKEWYFVINDKFNDAPPKIHRTIAELQTEYNSTIKIDFLTSSDLMEYFKNLEYSRKEFIVGYIPDISGGINKLESYTNSILDGIKTDINGITISRDDLLEELEQSCNKNYITLVSGKRGVGKSAIVKKFIEDNCKDSFVFALRSEELDKPHIQDVLTSIGVTTYIDDLKTELSSIPNKYLVIESLEKLFEDKHKAFYDLLDFASEDNGWTVIATIREYATSIFSYLSLDIPSSFKDYKQITVNDFCENELQFILSKIDISQQLTKNNNLKQLLKNPFYLQLTYKALSKNAPITLDTNESELKDILWNYIIRDEQNRKDGLPDKREKLFIDIAIERAKSMKYRINYDFFEKYEIRNKLEEDGILLIDKNKEISLSHDIWEDWAIYKYIDEAYRNHKNDIKKFFEKIENEPLINKAYREWIKEKYSNTNDDTIKKFILEIIMSNEVNSSWGNVTTASVLHFYNLEYLLDELNKKLFDEDNLLIRRFCFILRVYYKDFLFNKPTGNSWNIIIDFLYNNKEKITDSFFSDVIDLLSEWCNILDVEKEMPKISSKVALLSLYIFDKIKIDEQSKYDDNVLTKFCNVIIKTSSNIENEFTAIFENNVFNIDEYNRPKYVNILIKQSLKDEINSSFFAKYFPDLLIKLALDVWIKKKRDDENDIFIQQRIDIDWGISFRNEPQYASGLVPPFKALFSYHHMKAIDFIIKLSNITSEIYVNSTKEYNNSSFFNNMNTELGFEDSSHHLEPHNIEEVILELNDNTTKNQYSSLCMWEAYRATSVANRLIASALMALENWLIEFVSSSKKDEIEYIYNYILKNSNSVLTTAVLASIATGFPKLVGTSSFPILREASFYHLDITRLVHESVSSFVVGFNINKEYKEERKESLEREWRNKTLKNLCLELQYKDLYNDIIKIIDDSKLKYKDNKEILDVLHNMDIRNYKPIGKDGDNIIFSIPQEQTEEDVENQKKIDLHSESGKLSQWGDSILKNEGNENKYFNSFEDVLLKLKSVIESNENSFDLISSFGIIKASTALVQKYHNKISEEDLYTIFKSLVGYTLQGNSFMTDEAFEVLPIIYSYLKTDEDKKLIKTIIIKNLFSQYKYASFPTAIGIQKYLWQIDEDFAKQCFYNTIYFSQNGLYIDFYSDNLENTLNIFLSENKDVDINKLVLEQYNNLYLYSSFIMCLTKENEENYTDFIKKILSLIIETNNDKYYTISDNDIIKIFANYIFMIGEEKTKQFYDILNEGCLKQPSFMYLFLIELEGYAETNNDTSIFWNVYKSISDTMINITINNLDNKFDSDTKQLIRHMMFSNMPWQKQDLEKQYIKYGKEYILNFAKKTCNNINIFEGLASLMFYFNNIFFEDGIKILASIEEKNISYYLSKEITCLYLEQSIMNYLLKIGVEIKEDLHRSCLTILEKMIDKGSSKALILKDYLITSKKII